MTTPALPAPTPIGRRPSRSRPAVEVAADEPHEERLGRTQVVSPGPLDQGHYAIVDLQTLAVEPGALRERAAGERR